MKQIKIVRWADKYKWDKKLSPDETRALWLEACERADIWPKTAQQIADHFYMLAGGRIQPEHAPSAFRAPMKAGK